MTPDWLQTIADFGAAGLSLTVAYFIDVQALKRAELLDARYLPLVNLAAAAVIVAAYLYLPTAFTLLAGAIVLAALFTVAHGAMRKVMEKEKQ